MSSPDRTASPSGQQSIRAANHDRVATFERSQRAHGIERAHRKIQTRPGCAHAGPSAAFSGAAAIPRAGSTAREFASRARISRAAPLRDASARSSLETAARGQARRCSQVIEPLRLVQQPHARMRLSQPSDQPLLRRGAACQVAVHRAGEAMQRCIPACEPLLLIGHHQLGRAGGRWRAHVGDEIGDREVDLVPDAA